MVVVVLSESFKYHSSYSPTWCKMTDSLEQKEVFAACLLHYLDSLLQVLKRASYHLSKPVKTDEFLSEHRVHGLLVHHRVLVHHHLNIKRRRELGQDISR